MPRRWDIFCMVVDNFGDIGVCWRLAKQLTQDYRQIVRLWIDDLLSFSRIAPDVNPGMQRQSVQGIEICQWQPVFAEVEPADVVIEAFACKLPDAYIAAMLRKRKQPVWINLEYLSAEPWVVHYHGLPSPNPRFPLAKTFFFPGFVPGTGGLLREKHLMAQREAFDVAAEQAFLQQHKILERRAHQVRILLFCYDTAPIEGLVHILSESPVPVLLIVPQGKAAERIVALSGRAAVRTEGLIEQKQLTVQIIPFMAQADYDRLLWSCDINFVRGEDSFVRAQWALNPFIWNIYPQAEGAHWKKLYAFLDLYTVDMPPETASAVREMWLYWNGGNGINNAVWMNFLSLRESLTQCNKKWVQRLDEQADLVSNLVQFTENQL
ncbi:MAG: elongation factor P maturation arginine rhamnosyltransferase EarP [Gammaproteobacteria bacterium]|nr:MAG: elongation factor P maturation arginine rhamnosyltransferase EarP [Gammaproteobacteria bacterium]